jgi:hypothetical protein
MASKKIPLDQGSESNPGPGHGQRGKGTPQPENEADEKSASDNAPNINGIDDTAVLSAPGSTKWSPLRRAWEWKPKPARYDPDNPPKFTIWLNMLFGFVSDYPSSCKKYKN